MLDLIEKIKQKQFILWYATGRKSVHNSACPELEQSKPLVTVEDVLKILEDYTIIEKQKLQELADLLKKIEPLDHQLKDPYYFQLILTKEEKEKFVEMFDK